MQFIPNNNQKYFKKNLIRKKIKSHSKYKNTKQNKNKNNLSMKLERENRNLN